MNPDAEVIISKDHVLVVGQRINRPARISVMQWLDFWSRVKELNGDKK